MSHLHPEDGITGEADWDQLRTTSTRPSWWSRLAGRIVRSSRVPRREWPQALLLLLAFGLFVASIVAADSTTTSTSSGGILVLEETEGPGFLLFAGSFLVFGFTMLLGIFDSGIRRDTLIFLVLGLGAVGLASLALFTTPTSSTVTVDNSVRTIAVVEDYVFQSATDQTDLDQVLQIEYRYIPPKGEDLAFATISLTLDDGSSVELHRGEPETMDEWAKAIATQASLPMTAGS